MQTTLPVPLTWRDLQPVDLDQVAWTGSEAHLGVIGSSLERVWAGEVDLVCAELPSAALVALGGVDYALSPGAGVLWMLSVHPAWQSLGVGTGLVAALEERILDRGLTRAELAVEADNPRAAALYRRLGYRTLGWRVENWPTTAGPRFVSLSTVLGRDLGGEEPRRR